MAAPTPLLSAKVRFASADEAAALLGAEDDFTRALSAFDRQLRTKRTDDVSDTQFRAHAAQSALAWTDDEQNAWADTIAQLHAALEGLHLPLPDEVVLVRTDGREEFGANYTRQNAIVLPRKDELRDESHRFGLLAHELFHVASRRGGDAFRNGAYGLLGFVPVAPRSWPDAVEARRITNPDAHTSHHAVEVRAGDDVVLVVPALTSKVPIAEAVVAEPFFSIIDLQLLPTTPTGWVLDDDKRRSRSVGETDFMQRVAKNTHYVLHPEEVLADNFALLARRRAGQPRDVKDAAFVDGLEKHLSLASNPKS